MWGDRVWFGIAVMSCAAGFAALLLGLIGIWLEGKDDQ